MLAFFIIGIFLAFFLAFLILVKKEKRISDKLLLAWLIVIGLQILGYYTYSFGNWQEHPHTIGIIHPLPLAHGPFFYLMVIFTISKEKRFGWKEYMHFTPVLLMYIYMLPFFFGRSGYEKIIMNGQEALADSIFIKISRLIYIVSAFSYLIVSYFLLKKKLRSSGSYVRDNIFVLQYYIACGLFIIFLFAAAMYFLQGIGIIPGKVNVEYNIYSVAVCCLFIVSVYMVKNTGYLSDMVENGDLAHNFYGDEEDIDLYVDRLNKVMNLQKPYLDPDLNAETLADLSCIPKKFLSRIIRKFGFNNFYDFVNSYRIEEFKRKVGKPDNKRFDIFSLAYDSGFRARSTFYDNFKKLTGETPSDFIRKRKNNEKRRFNSPL